MCGICGSLGTRGNAESLASIGLGMAAAIEHRGPDDDGVWTDENVGLALAHRRLSIIDLSALGHQPMLSPTERYVVVLNGEIYNYQELRKELQQLGVSFRSSSDTEVLLAAVEEWGVQGAVERLVGMFAFALWDRIEHRLHLGRDRVGEKPLYYGWIGSTFVFGSELKALRAHPEWNGTIDRSALALYLRYSYVPAPYSIYTGIHKLRPGTILTIRRDQAAARPEPVPYWSASSVISSAILNPFDGSEEAAADELERLLKRSISQQMVADVPVGAFLSGGVDSSTVVALMQALNKRPVRTFTIGFSESAYNEAQHAKAVARHLGTDHTELYLTPADAMDAIPGLPHMYDEPFGDASQIPTYLVSRLARQSVTVSLSGDGGDELFGGYNRYNIGPRVFERVQRLPMAWRLLLSRVMRTVPPRMWDSVVTLFSRALPAGAPQMRVGEKISKLASILRSSNTDAVYTALVSTWHNPVSLVIDGSEHPLQTPGAIPPFESFVSRMMYLDLLSYLPDDILAKVDRAAMSVSLETRVPFLDHRVIEFAWRIPASEHLRDGVGKRLLRTVLYRHVPRSLIERPKMGFGVPVGDWLRGPLREWAEELLDEQRLKREGFLHAAPVRRAWAQHLNGTSDGQFQLWTILMFQAWLEDQTAVRATS